MTEILEFLSETVRENARRERQERDQLADLERRRRGSPAVNAAIRWGGQDVNSGSAADFLRAKGVLPPDDDPGPEAA
jgi:hypothetical protein